MCGRLGLATLEPLDRTESSATLPVLLLPFLYFETVVGGGGVTKGSRSLGRECRGDLDLGRADWPEEVLVSSLYFESAT